MHSREQLANDFRKLGVDAGDTVMLHASVRAVGVIAGGPDQIHLALKDVLTARHSLSCMQVARGATTKWGAEILTRSKRRRFLRNLHAFDPLRARSARDNGTLVEFFRTYPDSRVNHHVARCVVWGKQADYLISEQPWNYAFGLRSPLDRFLGLDGKVLLLGSDHDAVTFLHLVEHVVQIPGKRIARFQVPMIALCAHPWS